MAKSKRIGLLGATALGIATMMGGAVQANAIVPVSQNATTQPTKEAIPEKKDAVKPVQQRKRFNQFGNDTNVYKHIRTPKVNQRQKRKWRRANPNV